MMAIGNQERVERRVARVLARLRRKQLAWAQRGEYGLSARYALRAARVRRWLQTLQLIAA